MALARVVSFEGVTDERVAELTQRIEGDPRPEDVPAIVEELKRGD